MKVFISWSGDRSHHFANLLVKWLPRYINAVDPFVSKKLPPGARWGDKLASELRQSHMGIICLTPENTHQPWLLFEAGALSNLAECPVCPILFGVPAKQLEGPLGQFQHRVFEKGGFLELLIEMNRTVERNGERSVPERELQDHLDSSWPDVEREAAAVPDSASGDRFIESLLGDLRDILQRSWEIDNPVFRDEMTLHCNQFADFIQPWSRGEYRAERERYNSVLVDLYSRATTTVFSTCVSQYLATWTDELGKNILNAHRNGRAEVTRVFRFEKRGEVDADALRIMTMHEDTPHVTARVFIDDEQTYDFPKDLSRDFTLIDDGAVIGITTSYGADRREATWHFKDPVRARVLRDIRTQLLRSSLPLDEFVDDLNHRSKRPFDPTPAK